VSMFLIALVAMVYGCSDDDSERDPLDRPVQFSMAWEGQEDSALDTMRFGGVNIRFVRTVAAKGEITGETVLERAGTYPLALHVPAVTDSTRRVLYYNGKLNELTAGEWLYEAGDSVRNLQLLTFRDFEAGATRSAVVTILGMNDVVWGAALRTDQTDLCEYTLPLKHVRTKLSIEVKNQAGVLMNSEQIEEIRVINPGGSYNFMTIEGEKIGNNLPGWLNKAENRDQLPYLIFTPVLGGAVAPIAATLQNGITTPPFQFRYCFWNALITPSDAEGGMDVMREYMIGIYFKDGFAWSGLRVLSFSQVIWRDAEENVVSTVLVNKHLFLSVTIDETGEIVDGTGYVGNW